MGEVEVSVCEKGAPEVQHYDLRSSLRSMRPQGLQRHLVVQSPNCSYLFPEEEFNRGLKYSFILVLTWAVIILIIELSTTSRSGRLQLYVLLLALFAAVVSLEKKRRCFIS
ncbi:hypothetical protein CesoFtcFv8_019620 [Champsocephalus esox]|uniref:Uncharacterized protein n=1 Tax=Champsocephalus esox TaxID=159716 RepID=A0AAN8BDL8_9TELE|nr:hypothetical protein CesoFtcFv8_019620 [Champsocephalus esox]